MIVVFKSPGCAPELIKLDSSTDAIRKKLGGPYQISQVLKGAVILSRSDQQGIPYNVHFMGDNWHGPIILAGRGEGNVPTDLTPQLQSMLVSVLSQKDRKK